MMQLISNAPEATATVANAPRLSLSLASTPEEVREVQRLRYKVFIESGALTALANAEGLDRDEFDAFCDHLIVRDSRTLKVVGTYRLLNPQAARQLGRLYSEGEFDLSRLDHLRPRMIEAGRACIDPAYRSGAVIMLLWAGLAGYMRRHQCDYLVGCASISLADGGVNAAAVYHAIAATHLAPSEYQVMPRLRFPVADAVEGRAHQVPPLLKGYLRSGAWVCGDPAWDPDFECADLFLMLPLVNLDERYARRYLNEGNAQTA